MTWDSDDLEIAQVITACMAFACAHFEEFTGWVNANNGDASKLIPQIDGEWLKDHLEAAMAMQREIKEAIS